MCCVGGFDFNIEEKETEVARYKCNDCGNRFEGMGEKVVCPSCLSENVARR